MKTILMALAIILATTTTFAQATKDSTKMHHGHHGHHSQMKTKYTCTMHPEVVMNKPGKCPKCGMDLVPMKKKGKKMEKPIGDMKM